MAEQESISAKVERTMGERFKVSGDEAAYLAEFARVNLRYYAGSLKQLAAQQRWADIEDGARKLKAFAENIEWERLVNVCFVLQEASRQKNHGSIAAAQGELGKCIAELFGEQDHSSDTTPIKLEGRHFE